MSDRKIECKYHGIRGCNCIPALVRKHAKKKSRSRDRSTRQRARRKGSKYTVAKRGLTSERRRKRPVLGAKVVSVPARLLAIRVRERLAPIRERLAPFEAIRQRLAPIRERLAPFEAIRQRLAPLTISRERAR